MNAVHPTSSAVLSGHANADSCLSADSPVASDSLHLAGAAELSFPILPEIEFDARAPRNLRDSDRALLGFFAKSRVYPTSVAVLRDATAVGRGPLRCDGGYRDEYFVTENGREEFYRRKKHWRDRLESCVGARPQINAPTLWITDEWSCGYFHWMCDTLSRLMLAKRIVPLDQLTLLLPDKSRRFPFIQESLSAFPLADVRVLGRFERIACKTLVLPSQVRTSGHYHPVLVAELREYLNRHVETANRVVNRRIFLSRRDANRRRLDNERELDSVLKNHGFDCVAADQLSWKEQIDLFSSTTHLASLHGAGLSNMLAMPPGGKVLEIRDDRSPTPNCYLTLANVCDHDYYYALSQSSQPGKCVHHSNVTMKPEQLDRALGEMTAVERKAAV